MIYMILVINLIKKQTSNHNNHFNQKNHSSDKKSQFRQEITVQTSTSSQKFEIVCRYGGIIRPMANVLYSPFLHPKFIHFIGENKELQNFYYSG